jgi:serine/threonine protein kinase
MADTLNRNVLEIEEDPTVTGQVTSFKSTTQRSRSEVAPPRPLSCYGSAPKKFWSELSSRDVQDQSCDLVEAPEEFWGELSSRDVQDQSWDLLETLSEYMSPLEVRLLNPIDIFLLQKIGEGGQAHVFFATSKKFYTPLVVKRLKYNLKRGQEDLVELQMRMNKVMKTSRRNASAVCKVMGVGMDAVGNAFIVMERMGGDLRNLIDGVRCVGDGRMPYVDGQMPFDYSDTIKMMIDISQGMQDLHRCGLIHRDLKAANILVTPLPLDSHLGEVLIEPVELEQDLESFYFYVRIGDYESSDDVKGTRFWRPPEVLQSLKDGTEPVKWSFAGDVYSFGMLCYELLTGRIPFEEQLWTAYDVVLSGQRPELPPHVNPKMTELLHSCWQMEPEKRPGWAEIIESLSKELESHRPPGQGPRFYRRMKNQTTVVASSSSASPVSLGMQASSRRMESLPNSEHQTPGSFSSTGLLEMQQQGTGPVKSQALPIIWEEAYDFEKWEMISVWRELLQGHDIPNGETALKALMPREVARAIEDIAAVEVNITWRYCEAMAAWYAAMETWVPGGGPDMWWNEIQEGLTVDYGISFDHLWDKIRDVLDAWRGESPVEFRAWKEAVEEPCRRNAVYSEIDKLLERGFRVRINSPLIEGSAWYVGMGMMGLRDFLCFLLSRAKLKFQELDSPRAVKGS